MRLTIAALTLLLSSAGLAQDIEVSVTGPSEVASGGFALVGTGPDDAVLRWRVDSPDGAQPPLELQDTSGHPVLVFLNPSAGKYSVVLTGQIPAEGLDPFADAVHAVVVGDSPVPPGPEPGPGPTPPEPDPDPTPDDAPFPAPGLSALIVYDRQTESDLPTGQRQILYGANTRELLDDVTEDRYRIWSDDIDVSQAEEMWKAAMTVPRDSLPWLVISDGETGTSQPLPSTPEDFAALLQQFEE